MKESHKITETSVTEDIYGDLIIRQTNSNLRPCFLNDEDMKHLDPAEFGSRQAVSFR
jgi:hypothetical protein